MVIFDKIIGLLTKSLYLTLRIFLIFIIPLNILFLNLFKNYNSDRLLIVSLLLYLISLIITKKILYKEKDKQKNTKLFLFISLITAAALSIILFKNMPIYIYAVGIIYFVYLLYDSVKNSTQKENLDKEINTTIKTIILAIILIGLGRIFSDNSTIGLNRYLILYFLISLVYLCRINIKSEYESIYHDTLNKSKNMALFNIISILLITFLYISRDITYVIISGFKYLVNIVLHAIGFIITKIVNLILYVFVFIINKTPLFAKQITNKEMNISEAEESTELVLESSSSSNIIETILKVILIILFVIIIIKVLKIIYKKIIGYLIEHSETEDTEEKEFVYENKYILESIKNKIQQIISKYKNKEELYYIRKIYKNCVNKLIAKGYIFKKYYTPNEYIRKIPLEEINELEFRDITKVYNDYRYGQEMSINNKHNSKIGYKNNTKK